MSIEFKEGAVCFAAGTEWDSDNDFSDAMNCKDFQLNTIKQGDYISKSEIDTEDKYNRAVEVFGLFGLLKSVTLSYGSVLAIGGVIVDDAITIFAETPAFPSIERKITFNQLMAIGELKRLMKERDKSNHSAKPNSSASKVNRDIDAFKDGNKYHREIIGLDGAKTTVDVYRVLDAFKTGCPATDHAIKKMLCAGLRGHKDKLTDYNDAIESLKQGKALLIQKEVK